MRFLQHHLWEVVFAVIFAVVFAFWVDNYLKQQEQARMSAELHRVQSAIVSLISYDKNNQATLIGTGLFIRPDGVVVSNFHAIKSALVQARLSSGASYTLKKIIFLDRKADLSILQFDGQGVPFVSFGDSDKIALGQQISVEWSPSSFADGRILSASTQGQPSFIQFAAPTPAALSSGNLFDTDGDVLGVVTRLAVPPQLLKSPITKDADFAIPASRVQQALEGHSAASTEDSPDFFYSRGILEENRHQDDKAIGDFERAISLQADYSEAYLEIGGIYYTRGNFPKELEFYQKAAKYAPTDTDILYYLATAYEDVGQYDEAIAAHEHVLTVDPKYKDSLYQLGILYLIKGQRDKASGVASTLATLDSGLGGEIQLLLSRTP